MLACGTPRQALLLSILSVSGSLLKKQICQQGRVSYGFCWNHRGESCESFQNIYVDLTRSWLEGCGGLALVSVLVHGRYSDAFVLESPGIVAIIRNILIHDFFCETIIEKSRSQ